MPENTIQALRILQAGLEAVKAVGVLSIALQPTATETIVLGPITYTFIASGAVAGQINIGANVAATQVNVAAAINGTDGINTANPVASAAAFAGNNSTVTAKVAGPVTIATTETMAGAGNQWSAATLGSTTAGAHARGTAVAATSRLAVEQLEWSADDENVYNPQVQNGSLTRYQGPGTPVQHGTRFTLPDQAVIWEQLPLWFSMLFGPPAISGAIGALVYTWTNAPTTNPNPYAVTLQRRFTNGLGGNVDENAAYAMLSQLGLAFAVNEQLHLTGGQGFARKFSTMGGGITAGLTLPSFEVGVSALTSVYFDALWANVGNTLLAEQVIGWNWTMLNGTFPRYTAEARTSLDYTKHQFNGGERGLDMDVTCLLDPTTYAAELTRAGTPATNQFACRIKVSGSSGRLLNIDQMVQHDKALFAPGADQGQDTVTFTLHEAPDSTNFLRVALTLPTAWTP